MGNCQVSAAVLAPRFAASQPLSCSKQVAATAPRSAWRSWAVGRRAVFVGALTVAPFAIRIGARGRGDLCCMAAEEATGTRREAIHFGHLWVDSSQVLVRSPTTSSIAVTGIRPILPGHAVIFPSADKSAPVGQLSDLPESRLLDLWRTARQSQAILEAKHGATASNWSVFDGKDAGQPIPHTHVHVVARVKGDFEENDQVYEALEQWTPAVSGDGEVPRTSSPMDFPTDEDRRPRTIQTMTAEASRYRAALAADGLGSDSFPKEQAFAKIKIPGETVFFVSQTGLSVAFVNLKPLVPGHVLVVPRRVVPRISELTEEEFDDLFRSVQLVQAMVQQQHGAQASRLGLQDGRDSGQSVPHVHIHVLPMPPPKGVARASSSL